MNKLKGDDYEKFVLTHLNVNSNHKLWLWKDIPEYILIQFGFIHDMNQHRLLKKKNKSNTDIDEYSNCLIDTGIDLLGFDDNNNFIAIQCKNGYNNGLTISNISTFYFMMFNYSNVSKGYVYYTNSIHYLLQEHSVNNKITYVNLPMIENKQNDSLNEIIIKPFEYQKEAAKIINNYFKLENNIRAQLGIPCGKTLISYLISKKYDNIILISPLKQFAEQNLMRYCQYDNQFINNNILIDSDGIRDINLIDKFIKKRKNKKLLFSSTYKSVDVIYDILQKCNLNNVIIIFDEFHNISINNLTKEEDSIYKLLNSKEKILFLSATPRIYELENSEYEDIDISSMIGKLIYSMDFSVAIQNKYICDYNLYLPSISIDNSSLYTDIINEIGIDKIDNQYLAKCAFLFKCIGYYGSKKLIIYCKDTNDLDNLKKNLNNIKSFYCFDNIWIDEITSKTHHANTNDYDKYPNSREYKLNKFETNTNISILLSIQILDECIDIPACDSIFISYPTTSKIRTIQRMCRAMRIDKLNPNKKANIYLWCDIYSEILECLSSLKEYDSELVTKIKLTDLHLEKINIDENNSIKDELKLISDYVVGIKEFKFYTWNEKLEMLKKFINDYSKRPNIHTKDKYEYSIGQWLSRQIQNYKNNRESMNIKDNFDNWTNFINEPKYSNYMKDLKDIHIQKWYKNFNLLKDFLDKNEKRPDRDQEEEKTISYWLIHQNQYFKNNKILNEEIKNEWINFRKIKKYYDYIRTNEERWFDNLNDIKLYIDTNKKFIIRDNDYNIQLVTWFNYQNNIYLNDKMLEYRHKLWKEFIEDKKYNKYFKVDNEKLWDNNLNEVKKYIDVNNKRPIDIKFSKKINFKSDNKEQEYKIKEEQIKNNNYLVHWIADQYTDYKQQKLSEQRIQRWKEFIEDDKYVKYFYTNEQLWYISFEKVKKFIFDNHKRPPRSGKIDNIVYNDIKILGSWLHSQLCSYKTQCRIVYDNEEIRKVWENHLDDDFYGKYLSSEDK